MATLTLRLRASAFGWVAPVALSFGVSRLLVLLAAILAGGRPVDGTGGPILGRLTSWDGWWYLGIAQNGYHAAPLKGQGRDLVFFPLWPSLIHAASFFVPALAAAVAVILANLLFLLGLALFYRLTADLFDDGAAAWSCLVLALFPWAWVFSMAYTESLLLALSAGALLAAERGHGRAAAILTACAALTRLPGLLVALPVALVLWRSDRRALPWLALAPAAAVVFFAYTASLVPGGFLAAESAWAVRPWDGPAVAAFVGFAALLGVVLWRRSIRWPYAAWCAATLAMILAASFSPSVGRYGMMALPFMWVLAGSRWRVAWLGFSGVAFAILAAGTFAGLAMP